ncbi:MAG: DNA replication/repair protein RecF [Pseudomonadales bacterium]|nr:DNA replication/repair protein RecF [Gammaproteobacteria bacterium]MBP6479542.1 DNA replication/repair protein RecF [Pseudomonadales bacterium]MBP7910668.1 DNA replication/repair protein RecF [Pseudomonadales bacterium]
MSIRRLRISQLRNIRQAELELGRVNLLSGPNGSGKTSVLEAVFVLGSGRSFRAARLDPVIHHDASQFTVFASLQGEGNDGAPIAIGVSRSRDGNFAGRIQGQAIRNSAELARRLPLQLINSDTFDLLVGGPKVRRQFLDWGVFHVEHGFHRTWLDVHRCLRQRNALLRHDRIPAVELEIWNSQLVESAAQLDEMRQHYFDAFHPIFLQTLRELLSLDGLELAYQRGWDRGRSLEAVLAEQIEKDRVRGFTQSGPHRADVRVRLRGINAAEVLSRGQQKLVGAAMKLAQGRLFSARQGRDCVFLVDDLPSELDRVHRRQLCQLLGGMRCQVLLSCVDASELSGCWDGLAANEMKLFHVEHGALSAAK